MKFKKVARDRKSKLFERGDIVLFRDGDDSSAVGVVRRVVRRGRDQFPAIELLKIEDNYRGEVTGTSKRLVDVDTYKESVVLNPSLLRDDVGRYRRAKELQTSLIGDNPRD